MTLTTSSSKEKKLDISKLLGPNGKLLPEEEECCRKNNLCMTCGSSKHAMDDCPLCKLQVHTMQLESVEESHSDDSLSEAESSDSPN